MSILYSNLKGGRCRRQIAKYFGVADTIMVSWLHTITYVRNICAHSNKINVLLEEYPNIDIVAMGFPENWKEQPLWKS